MKIFVCNFEITYPLHRESKHISNHKNCRENVGKTFSIHHQFIQFTFLCFRVVHLCPRLSMLVLFGNCCAAIDCLRERSKSYHYLPFDNISQICCHDSFFPSRFNFLRSCLNFDINVVLFCNTFKFCIPAIRQSTIYLIKKYLLC